LVDMGVEPFLVASTVEAVMAQRLVRTLCKECCESYVPTAEQLPADFPHDALRSAGGSLVRPVGCRACRNVGYLGRIGLYELLITTEQIRSLAHDGASSWEINESLLPKGCGPCATTDG